MSLFVACSGCVGTAKRSVWIPSQHGPSCGTGRPLSAVRSPPPPPSPSACSPAGPACPGLASLPVHACMHAGGSVAACYNDLWALDTLTMEWLALPPTPESAKITPRAGHACAGEACKPAGRPAGQGRTGSCIAPHRLLLGRRGAKEPQRPLLCAVLVGCVAWPAKACMHSTWR